MRDYQSFEVRNVSVIGHSGAGKTSVLEAMLYYTKATDRFGKTTEGSSMIDFDAEEIRRGDIKGTKKAGVPDAVQGFSVYRRHFHRRRAIHEGFHRGSDSPDGGYLR